MPVEILNKPLKERPHDHGYLGLDTPAGTEGVCGPKREPFKAYSIIRSSESKVYGAF